MSLSPAQYTILAGDLDRLAEQVEYLWPGLTALAREAATEGVVIGIKQGRLLCWYPAPVWISARVPNVISRLTIDPPHPRWTAPMPDAPKLLSGLTPKWFETISPLRSARYGLSPLEAAVTAGMDYYWCPQQEQWTHPIHGHNVDQLSDDDAAAAERYLRREWFTRRADLQSHWPWRYDRPELVLNGPTEGPEARWFSTAYAMAYWLLSPQETAPSYAAVLSDLAANLTKPRGYLAPFWDWTLYDESARGTNRQLAVKALAYNDQAAPWPIWADEFTAERRLLQRAAELWTEANPAWLARPQSKPREIKPPTDREWRIIDDLLRVLSQDQGELSFHPGGLTHGVGHRSFPVVTLWAVIQGWGHLRRCEECNAWIARISQRPVTVCSQRCASRRHHRSPAARVKRVAVLQSELSH